MRDWLTLLKVVIAFRLWWYCEVCPLRWRASSSTSRHCLSAVVVLRATEQRQAAILRHMSSLPFGCGGTARGGGGCGVGPVDRVVIAFRLWWYCEAPAHHGPHAEQLVVIAFRLWWYCEVVTAPPVAPAARSRHCLSAVVVLRGRHHHGRVHRPVVVIAFRLWWYCEPAGDVVRTASAGVVIAFRLWWYCESRSSAFGGSLASKLLCERLSINLADSSFKPRLSRWQHCSCQVASAPW